MVLSEFSIERDRAIKTRSLTQTTMLHLRNFNALGFGPSGAYWLRKEGKKKETANYSFVSYFQLSPIKSLCQSHEPWPIWKSSLHPFNFITLYLSPLFKIGMGQFDQRIVDTIHPCKIICIYDNFGHWHLENVTHSRELPWTKSFRKEKGVWN